MSAASAKKPRSTQPLAAGRVVGERYVVQRVLGQGGMGQVVEVEHVSLGRRFALKVLRLERWNDELVRRFNREARALARLTTPRVAQVTDFGVDEECGPFYVMELLTGETLEQRIERQPLGAHEALTLCAELCDALREVHAAGIVHRDLKPSNVGLPDTGPVGVKLLDFGLAASMDDAFLSRITQSQQILGSLPYMAPEQFNGAELTPSVDIYAVGVVLYESLLGRLPFLAPSTAALIHQILSTPPPALPRELATLGPLEPLLERLLAKEPAARFASAGAAAQALRQAAARLEATRGAHPATRVASQADGAPVPRTHEAHLPLPPTAEARAMGADGIGHMPTMMAAEIAPPAESGTRLSSHGHGTPAPEHVGHAGGPHPGPSASGAGATPAGSSHPHASWGMAPTEASPVHPVPHPAAWAGPVHPGTPYPGAAPTAPIPPARPSTPKRLAVILAVGLLLFGVTAVAVVVGLSVLEARDTVEAGRTSDQDDTPPPPPTLAGPEPPEGVVPPAEPPAPEPASPRPDVESGEVAAGDDVPSDTLVEDEERPEAGDARDTAAVRRDPAVRPNPRSAARPRDPGPTSTSRVDPPPRPQPLPQPRGTPTWQGDAPSRQW